MASRWAAIELALLRRNRWCSEGSSFSDVGKYLGPNSINSTWLKYLKVLATETTWNKSSHNFGQIVLSSKGVSVFRDDAIESDTATDMFHL